MAGKTLTDVVRDIGRLAKLRTDLALPDADLLERYILQRDEAAFEALLHRHGPLVFGVCRRLLYNAHDAEDAFQATFLILARKAGSVVPRSQVGNWLYGVAYRVAARARKLACRRAREQLGKDLTAVPSREKPSEPDLPPLLHAEVERLPDKYRSPIVLCYLEGKTNEEAARLLQWPIGTVKIRLSRARELLRSRLALRGVALSAGLLTANAMTAPASAALLQGTFQAALSFAAGSAVVGGAASAQALALTKGELQTMFLSKLKLVAAAVLSVAVVAGAGGLAYHGLAVEPQAKDEKKADKPKDDKEAILGTWRVVTQEQQGQSKEESEEHRLIFSADGFTIKKGDETLYKGKFKIDASKKPKTIDMEIIESAKGGNDGKTGLGIYSLEGDTLKWCVNEPGETERPKEFSAPSGTRLMFVTFKREKP
jgi:RNA polymerase sigma factor (sigma-70 family)